jgi:hypothetical protein
MHFSGASIQVCVCVSVRAFFCARACASEGGREEVEFFIRPDACVCLSVRVEKREM